MITLQSLVGSVTREPSMPFLWYTHALSGDADSEGLRGPEELLQLLLQEPQGAVPPARLPSCLPCAVLAAGYLQLSSTSPPPSLPSTLPPFSFPFCPLFAIWRQSLLCGLCLPKGELVVSPLASASPVTVS